MLANKLKFKTRSGSSRDCDSTCRFARNRANLGSTGHPGCIIQACGVFRFAECWTRLGRVTGIYNTKTESYPIAKNLTVWIDPPHFAHRLCRVDCSQRWSHGTQDRWRFGLERLQNGQTAAVLHLPSGNRTLLPLGSFGQVRRGDRPLSCRSASYESSARCRHQLHRRVQSLQDQDVLYGPDREQYTQARRSRSVRLPFGRLWTTVSWMRAIPKGRLSNGYQCCSFSETCPPCKEYTWCSEIGSLTSLDACNSGKISSDVREPISLHQAVVIFNDGWFDVILF